MTHTERTEFLGVEFDRLAFQAVTHRLARVTAGSPYSFVVTPNVDHVVRLHSSPDLWPLYREANLCLCDSRILRRLAQLGGIELPVVPGSDLTQAVISEIIERGDRIAVVGATPQVVQALQVELPGVTILHHVPPMGLREDPAARRAAAAFIANARTRFTFLAVGSPQQEIIARDVLDYPNSTGVALCIGASLEFLTGHQKRAPRLLQLCGLEWAHRLASNPSRMWRRYLVDGMTIFPIFVRSRHSRRLRWVAGGAAALVIAAVAIGIVYRSADEPRDGAFRPAGAVASTGQPGAMNPVPVNLPPPDLLRPLSTEQATELNAERPFAARADDPSSRFFIKPDAPGRLNALTCLTQAVYYEAASEGLDGGRAVAQVVLNRVRHPAYPASVCGVVYQGSTRQTGCQFSFTCDGSLLRIPSPAIWNRSRKIAEEALAGRVFAPVGHATYYHADYVVPYWADSLDKMIQIGRHIFYRLRGSLGESRLFRQTYSGSEVISTVVPPTIPGAVLPEQAAPPPPDLITDGSTQRLPESKPVPAEPALRPLIDLTRGTLIADGDAPAPIAQRRKPPVKCQVPGVVDKQLRPLGVNQVRTTSQSTDC